MKQMISQLACRSMRATCAPGRAVMVLRALPALCPGSILDNLSSSLHQAGKRASLPQQRHKPSTFFHCVHSRKGWAVRPASTWGGQAPAPYKAIKATRRRGCALRRQFLPYKLSVRVMSVGLAIYGCGWPQFPPSDVLVLPSPLVSSPLLVGQLSCWVTTLPKQLTKWERAKPCIKSSSAACELGPVCCQSCVRWVPLKMSRHLLAKAGLCWRDSVRCKNAFISFYSTLQPDKLGNLTARAKLYCCAPSWKTPRETCLETDSS